MTASPTNFSTVPPYRSISRETRVVRAERGPDVLGVGPVGAGREADEVDEEHGDDLALLAGRRCLERRAAGEAEARALRVLLAAVGADDHRASVRTWHKADTAAKDLGGYVREMDEARSVLRRLERIEALERRGSPAELMLAELRELVAEAEAWVRVEPGPTEGAEDAIERLRQAVADPERAGEDSASLTRKHARMGFLQALRRPAAADTDTSEGVGVTRVIAFANQKGGVAKTTSTLNLAVAFAEQGLRVLAVDLDPQGNLTMSQGLNPDTIERSMYDVLVHRLPIEQVLHKGEIDLAVSSIDLAGAELALSSLIGRERALEKGLAPVKDDYDWILIDTPPSLGLLDDQRARRVRRCDRARAVQYLSLRGLVQLENTLSMIRENINPDVEIQGILPTMFDGRTLHAREAVEILEENFGDLVFKTRIRKTIRYAEAPVKGASILKYDPTGTAAEAYRDLAKEVLNGAQARQHA